MSFFALFLLVSVCLGCDTTCTYKAVYSNNGQSVSGYYNGTVSKTITGVTCCPWNVSKPAWAQVNGTNYCRTGGIDTQAWCHTNLFSPCDDVSTETWEYCDVGTYDCPICSDPVEPTYPDDPLTYPCIAPQALASTGDEFITRVVGGQDAIPHEFPFYVSIQRNGGVYCGGSLVDKDWILTAAHCTYEDSGSRTPLSVYTIKIGLQNADDDSSTNSCVEERTVISSIVHPNYNSNTQANDLAFLKLSSSSAYPPILLNAPGVISENIERAGLMVNIVGLGTEVYDAEDTAYTLQKSVLPIYGQELCQQYWGDIIDSEICAGYWGGGVDTCQGDSGGPLFVKRGTTFIQIGTVSYGYECAQPMSPGVYMRVSSFHTWICSNSALSSLTTLCHGTVAPTIGGPTPSPTARPTTKNPTGRPTRSPTNYPTRRPTLSPTTRTPSRVPTTRSPTNRPSKKPTRSPTTRAPIRAPSKKPTRSPTLKPTAKPSTPRPSKRPTQLPTTRSPTSRPTKKPTKSPTQKPTKLSG